MRTRKRTRESCVLAILLGVFSSATWAEEIALGGDVSSLLEYARTHSPEYAGMRHEAVAAAERVTPAGALPDPKLRMELRDITRMGDQAPTVLPNRVGSTQYTVMQDLPWPGKRDLKAEIARLEAKGSEGAANQAWAEIAAKIKTAYAQLQYVHRNEQLTREILDLMVRLEKIAQVRYAGGLAAQQDVIRAQVEQTGMRGELIALENESLQLRSRINTLLARPAAAPLGVPERSRVLPASESLVSTSLVDRVRNRNPQLLADEARLGAAEKNRELTYKNRYPDFTIGVSPIQYRNSVKEWELMLELNIPLQVSSRRAQEREAEAMRAAAEARRDTTANQVLGDLAGNLSAYQAARRTEMLVATSLQPQAEVAFKAALAGYETGKVDFATLLDAQRQIRQARQSRIKAEADAQMNLAEIERILGEDL